MLDFLGREAMAFPPADDTAVTVADTGTEPSQDFAVLVAPVPDARFAVSSQLKT